MGLFDFFSSEQTPTSVGTEILRAYYDEAKNFSDFTYKSFDQWLAALKLKVSDITEVIGDLVLQSSASTTVSESKSRVAYLANQTGGKATIPQIVQASGGKGDVNLSAAIPAVAKQSAKDIAKVAQNVGQGVIGSLNMLKFLPVILIGGGVLAIYFYSSSAGKTSAQLFSRKKK